MIDRSFDWLIDWLKFVVFMMIDVIKIFEINFIIINSKNSDSNSKNLKNLKNSENSKNSQNSIDFKKFEKFIIDLFQRIYIYDYVDFFFNFINTMIIIRIDFNDRFFYEKKSIDFWFNWKIMKYDNIK